MKKKRINNFKYFSLFFAIAVLAFIAGCNGTPPSVPIINSFSASPSTITVGDSSTLSWSVIDATSVTLDHAIGSVALTGTTAVNPTTTTTYTLTVTNTAGSVTAATTVTVSSYVLLDIGPAGGYVFADKGYYSSGWRYLEAAPVFTEWTSIQWGSYGTLIGGTATGIGVGQSNTTTIVTWLNSYSETGRAAQLCNDLTVEGYMDWFLPSKDELNLMYINLKVAGVGGFAEDDYWSSSEVNAYYAWSQHFSNGLQYNYPKDGTFRVRAVRAF
jgi:hypothetical protein